MSKTEKTLKKHIFATIWAVLSTFLLLGLFVHQADWNTFWALWATEVLTFGLLAFYLWKPTAISAFTMFAGSVVWLASQAVGWYRGDLLVFLGQQAQLDVIAAMNVITFAVNAGLFYYAFSHRKGGGSPPFKFASVQNTAFLGFIIVAAFAGAKLYWTYTGPQGGSLAGTSGITWATGIAVMAAASIVNLKFTRKENTIVMLVGVVGLLVAMYAALYYGLALSIVGV